MGKRGFQPTGLALTQVERNRRWRARKALEQQLAQPRQPDDDWRGQAACKGKPSHLFFPEGPWSRLDEKAAKAICAACPVTRACLEAGRGEPDGIWGGLTPKQRRQRFKETA